MFIQKLKVLPRSILVILFYLKYINQKDEKSVNAILFSIQIKFLKHLDQF